MFKHIPLPKKGRKNRATPELSPAETFAEASHKVLTRLDTSVLCANLRKPDPSSGTYELHKK